MVTITVVLFKIESIISDVVESLLIKFITIAFCAIRLVAASSNDA